MKIYGFVESSVVGHDIFAPSIFLKGCNLKCPYCINCDLIDGELREYPLEMVLSFIKENNCKIINISGGEPLNNRIDEIQELIFEIKSLGCNVGMSTNGSYPYKLKNIIDDLSYVALDIKTMNEKIYESIWNGGETYLITNVITSLNILKDNKRNRDNFNFEVRTTTYPPFVNESTVKEISSLIDEGESYVIQVYRNNTRTLKDCKSVTPYSKNEVEWLLDVAKKCCKGDVSIRYV